MTENAKRWFKIGTDILRFVLEVLGVIGLVLIVGLLLLSWASSVPERPDRHVETKDSAARSAANSSIPLARIGGQSIQVRS